MEIERKFLVHEEELLTSIVLSNYKSYDIQQAYIATDDVEVRIRKIEDSYANYKCFMTIKSKGGLARNEVEFEIPYGHYINLTKCNMYKGNIIEKLRYKIPLENNIIAELDIYDKDLFGLLTVEVEFKTEEEANSFIAPAWFGREVTNDKKYKNKNLALKGLI